MRRLALPLWLLLSLAGCKDSAATCEGQLLPDTTGDVGVCQPGPNCGPCWSCQTFGSNPGWTIIPGMCDAPGGQTFDGRTADAPAADAGLVRGAPGR